MFTCRVQSDSKAGNQMLVTLGKKYGKKNNCPKGAGVGGEEGGVRGYDNEGRRDRRVEREERDKVHSLTFQVTLPFT